ncbi:MAG: hypothetical protein IKW46_00560 [Bacteroidaceae bacterium]|nr:hypothetical protein [Bacteroidaceae bacterium]
MDEIRNTLQELDKKCSEHACYAPVKEQVAQALRAIEQFNSGIEVIVCMGMLKAGKSTMVNLLTRSPMASPMGYGLDTTLRPALIRMAEQGAAPRIILYERAESAAGLDAAQLLGQVMDHLRGIAGEEMMEQVSIRTLPLNEQTLRGVLCHQVTDTPHLTSEPVLVVVETAYDDKCTLLRHRNRMILDMPGCDSATAEVSRGERYRVIGKECDMVLLLQSSVAPLNAKAVEEMKALLAGRTPSTTRIIQNRMESKAWLRREVLAAESLDQSSRALAILRQLSENRELPVSAVNLGMAYAGVFEDSARLREQVELPDGIYKSPAELLAGSGFVEMEDALHSELADIRYLHCCDELRQALRSLAAATLLAQRNEGQLLTALRTRAERWDAFTREAEKALSNTSVPADAVFSVMENKQPDFALICEDIYRARRELYKGPKATGKDINECMIDCNKACMAALKSFLYNELTDKHVQMTAGDFNSSVAAWCNRSIKGLLQGCKTRLQELDRELWSEFTVPEQPDFHDWQEVHALPLKEDPTMKENRFNPYIYEERVQRWWWWDGNKEYEVFWGNELFVGKVIVPMIKHYCDVAQQQLKAHPPIAQIQKIIKDEVHAAAEGFFSALAAKKERTHTDIAQAEQRQNSLKNIYEKIRKLVDTYGEGRL